ncbi:ATP-binding protein [Streptomyces sp. T-3]|nr:ATP-binding protein [Streptomyces sp. T-3]
MNHESYCVRRKPWDLDFEAEPREVAGLRRVLRLHLAMWGLPELVDLAQSCVTELTSNVINHVGIGTPTRLAVSMRGTYLRLELHDPDTRALPTLLAAGDESETGRGMALVDAIAERWGVLLREDSKVVWCELATELQSPDGHTGGPRVEQAEACLVMYGATRTARASGNSRLNAVVAEEEAIDLIADLLHWLRVHGCDPDWALDRAQMHFEAELGESA